jgi:hypothetical protein
LAREIRRLKQDTRVFSCKTEAELRKLKKDMMLESDFIDINSQTEELSSEKNNRMKEIYGETTRI